MKVKLSAPITLIVFLFSSFMYGPVLAADKPVVKMAFMADAAPISWLENNVPSGITVEILNLICNNLGIEAQHIFHPWKRSQLMIKLGKADVMVTTPTGPRFKYAVFGKESALPNYWNVFVHKDNFELAEKVKGFTSLEGLKPYEIVDFLGNGWAAAFLKKEDGYNINEVPKIEKIPILLAAKRGDVAINSSTWTNWWADKTGMKDQLVEIDVNWFFTRFHFVLMVSRKSPWVEKGLIRAMDQELLKMKKAGIWHKILAKYKNPHGFGKEFKTHLDAAYLEKGGFYKDYDNYPIYKP